MLRKDRVLHLLLQLTRDQYEMRKENLSGITAKEIADHLKITSANASKELNPLVKESA
ncbi:hypothetical protein IW492_02185 [Enterococcus sp. BWB1-3]|uniref:hypothetical protein n=1 Tax=Enterococcus sp. BWB1-3 TaxID=2787713 RepID=UPI001922D125|nr:hypothetical protein [Enterococcus sp. BWB1-3]MBL1228039.1 hypothetical protein [Enterococcus sp. BWB1-3]